MRSWLELKLWDIQKGEYLKTLQGHMKGVWSVAFSFDGSFLASGSDDQSLKLWNLSNGQCLDTLYGHTNTIMAVTFSPDGRRLAYRAQSVGKQVVVVQGCRGAR